MVTQIPTKKTERLKLQKRVRGIFSEVARQTATTPQHVIGVWNRKRQSSHVESALLAELNRRIAASTHTDAHEQRQISA